MNTLEKAELIASIHHIAIFLISAKPIYNSEVSHAAGRKMRRKRRTRRRRRRTWVTAKRYAFHANAKRLSSK